mgnify:CR=1 FL=1
MRKINTFFEENENSSLSYIRELFAIEDNLLKDIRNECLIDSKPITINPEDGKLIQLLIKTSKIKTIIEVGTLYGYSAIWFARALPSDGKIYTIEKEEYNSKIAKKYFDKLDEETKNKIIQINGNAESELEKLISKNITCDMIFIDADKSSYIKYLKLSDRLVKHGGLIVADNTLLSGGVYLNYLPERITVTAQNNMREFNRELSNKDKYCSTMLNTHEGLAIAYKH